MHKKSRAKKPDPCNRYYVGNLFRQLLRCDIFDMKVAVNDAVSLRIFRLIPEYRFVSIAESDTLASLAPLTLALEEANE